MNTLSISVTKAQVGVVDKLISLHGFANRSEFFRALLRLVAMEPAIINSAIAFPFVTPDEKSTAKVVESFRNTKTYSPEFLQDLEEGLNESGYFTK